MSFQKRMIDENLMGNNMNRHHFKYHTWRPYSCPKNYSARPQSLFFVSNYYPDSVCLIQNSSKFLISDMRLTMIDRPLKTSECPSLPGLWRMHSILLHHSTIQLCTVNFDYLLGDPFLSLVAMQSLFRVVCRRIYIFCIQNGRTYFPITFDGFISILWQIRW